MVGSREDRRHRGIYHYRKEMVSGVEEESSQGEGDSEGGSLRPETLRFDGDGYLFHTLALPFPSLDEVKKAMPTTWQEIYLASQVHFALRSSVMVPEGRSDEYWRFFNKFSAEMAFKATVLARYPDRLPLPMWARASRARLCDALRSEYPDIDSVSLRISFTPRLFAWSNPDSHSIEVSMLTREYLMRVNLALWSAIYRVNDDPSVMDRVPEALLSYFTPFFWSLSRISNHSALPVIRTYCDSAEVAAAHTTARQLDFLVAHEYAHLLLHADCELTRLEREREADRFALEAVVRAGESAGDLYLGVRWLFSLLAIERTFASLLNGGPVDWAQDELLARGSTPELVRLANETDSVSIPDVQCDQLGRLLLSRVWSVLKDRGPRPDLEDDPSAPWFEALGIPSADDYLISLVNAALLLFAEPHSTTQGDEG